MCNEVVFLAGKKLHCEADPGCRERSGLVLLLTLCVFHTVPV